MSSNWRLLETTTYQDHVIAHIVGATVLAYFIHDDSAHLLLDMEFIWTIYVDGQMSLHLYPVAIAELELEDAVKLEIKMEIQKILGGASDDDLNVLRKPPCECVIDEVLIYETDNQRRLLIKGESGNLVIESDIRSGEIVLSG